MNAVTHGRGCASLHAMAVRRLYIVGSGETAERLVELGGALAYDEVHLRNDLPDLIDPDAHVVIAEDDVTRGRALMLELARAAVLPTYAAYAAPHREGWKMLLALAASGIPKERLDAIAAPAGVAVGAETPAEVAIATAAELVALRRELPRPSAGLPVAGALRGASRRARVVSRRRRTDGSPTRDRGGDKC